MKDINTILNEMLLTSQRDKKAMERFNRQSLKMERLIDELERACGFSGTKPKPHMTCRYTTTGGQSREDSTSDL